MGVADHLPDPAVRLRKANHSQRVVLIALRNVDGHVFIEPVVSADDVWHAAEGLEDYIAILSDKKLVELLGRIGCRAVVVILGQGFGARKREDHQEGEEGPIHPALSSELCGKAPASP